VKKNPQKGVALQLQKKSGLDGKWFNRLDWSDNNKFKNFGLNKRANHEIASQVDEPIRGKGHNPTTSSYYAERKKASVLAALVENSRKTLEANFD